MYVIFPLDAMEGATLPPSWTDELISQIWPAQQVELRREVRQMAEWNRRAAWMRVAADQNATSQEKSDANSEALRINKWFEDQAWMADVDASLQPVTSTVDPARIIALAKVAGKAAQSLATIAAAVDGIRIATLLVNALKSEAGPTAMLSLGSSSKDELAAAARPFSLQALLPALADFQTAGAKPAVPPTTPVPAPTAAASDAAVRTHFELVNARVQANEALMKTLLGTISASGDPAGKTTAGEGSGLLEGTLLASDVMRGLGRTIAEQVKDKVQGDAGVILLQGSQVLDVALWRAARSRVAALNDAYKETEKLVADAKQALASQAPSPPAGLLPLAPIAAVVTAAGTLTANAASFASYFQTSYTLKGASIDGLDHQLLGTAVAEALAPDVALLTPEAAASETQAMELVGEISGVRQRSVTDRKTIEALQKRLIEASSSNGGNAPASAIVSAAAAMTACDEVSKACDAALVALTTPDASGTVPLAAIASQAPIGAALDAGALVLRVQAHKTASGLYTEEHGKIRQFFFARDGKAPDIRVSGGGVASFRLQNADGRVLVAGVLRDQTEYLELEKIDGWLEAR